jgi:hypothetical protein
MVIKKTKTTSGATGSGGNDGSGGTIGSGASRGLDKASSVIGTSIGTTGTAEVVIHPPLIAKITSLCGITEDSMMVMFMFKKKWKELYHIRSSDFDDINAFHTAKKDFKTVYIRIFTCFLLYYKRKCRENGGSHSEGYVVSITSAQFKSMLVLVNMLGILKLGWRHTLQSKMSSRSMQMLLATFTLKSRLKRPMLMVIGSSMKWTWTKTILLTVLILKHVRKDVINDDKFVAERMTGEDVSMASDASKHVMEHDLEESTPGGD